MTLQQQIVYLFIMALPIACVAWTVTHEEVFREPREYCEKKSQNGKTIIVRKFFYLFTCEYCFSHYIVLIFLIIAKYQLLQRKIVERIIPSLKKGNQLLYITCSVFRQENEENIKWAEEKFGLTTKKLDTIRGYTLGADTMFAALLTL